MMRNVEQKTTLASRTLRALQRETTLISALFCRGLLVPRTEGDYTTLRVVVKLFPWVFILILALVGLGGARTALVRRRRRAEEQAPG